MFGNSLNFLFYKKINISRLGNYFLKGNFSGNIRVRGNDLTLNGENNIKETFCLLSLDKHKKKGRINFKKGRTNTKKGRINFR